MNTTVISRILTASVFALALISSTLSHAQDISEATLYQQKVDGLEGETIDFAKFKGKKVLIVNTASKCGYTPQYKGLQELYNANSDKLVIVGFPANNFGGQEPGSNGDIAEFCERNYGVSFPMAAKVSVKGDDMDPMFKWLTATQNPDFTGDIRWNFEKFLFDEQGKLIHRYRSGVKPKTIAEDL